jgi:peptidylprolyl isomerase
VIRHGWVVAGCVTVGLLLSGCAAKSSTASGDLATSSPITLSPSPTQGPTLGPGLPGTPTPTKPVVKVPEGPPPTQLVIKDLTKGTGPEATATSSVSVQYVGVSWSTGKQFDASWDRGQPLDVTLGSGSVIPGWEQGIPGMRVGGRRELIIPPSLAYGAQGYPPSIKPNETLIFVIDLVAVH